MPHELMEKRFESCGEIVLGQCDHWRPRLPRCHALAFNTYHRYSGRVHAQCPLDPLLKQVQCGGRASLNCVDHSRQLLYYYSEICSHINRPTVLTETADLKANRPRLVECF